MHKSCTHKHKGTILCVDTYMRNKCPWKSIGAEEEALFDDVQIESDLADFEHETASNRVVYETSTDLCQNRRL